ncbi:MAG TPA: MOSC domain-containing protein [Gemmatimonadales bacterium]|nr:MOSC domain-containing protein [Gemmatimonadales bacterium]
MKPETHGETGLPKQPVASLRLTSAGAVGDFNRYRTHRLNGDPDSAVLLLTEDILLALRAEGWPVAPGHLGENVLLAGIPAAALDSGKQVRLGDALLEVTRACDPCSELYGLPYVGKARGSEFIQTLHGRRGWYARVINPGTVELGTPAQVTQGDPQMPDYLPSRSTARS